MNLASFQETQKAFLTRRQEFEESLAALFSEEFFGRWLSSARTFYRATAKASKEEKAEHMKEVLPALSVWIEDLRVRLLRDLARFVQTNQGDFNGDAKNWMAGCCNEIWWSTISEEAFGDWFAKACDDTSNLEKWRAPLWLAIALGIPNDNIRLQEQPEQSEYVKSSRHSPEEFDDCDRLDLESTEELITFSFALQELSRRIGFSARESKEIAELLVFLGQGAKLPSGLHNNEEKSASAIARQLAGQSRLSPTTRRSRRLRPKTDVQKEREREMRRIIKEGWKGISYCKKLDESGIPVPVIWIARGCPPTYVRAYMAGDPWRHNIFSKKSSLTKTDLEISQRNQKSLK